MSKDLHKLESAVASIKKIKKYTAGLNYEEFSNQDVIIDAVLMHFGNLGEKLGGISPEFKNKHDEIPYRDAKDMRNYVAHQYEGVNALSVWNMVTEIIPNLEVQLKKILDD
ncbi:hypothetical protein BST97_11450 [Nonlabens spongiae]|uniref:DUF86 domain-containing protein n=1 Tax=Nonlabens spongiae TaxID=331648 RepID=A0A1W6MLV0_9FLAO|nr:HepT-like ribonuclease domain-containing protein [Nonlabens spongiae]ARN78552.1 hypothetical protein BST97_11450 [Nonlabens spongiae]